MDMAIAGEVFVVTASGSGHLFPCIELCKHLSTRNYTPILVLPSTTAAHISPSNLHPISAVIGITAPTRGKPSDGQMGSELEAHLAARSESHNTVCAIIDFQMGWTKHIFWKFKIPVISFFTFGACAAAMEWGAWKSLNGGLSLNPGETHLIPGLPDEMNINHQDLARRPTQPSRAGGPPRPGDQPPWVSSVEGSIASMFNTCDDLERPFICYLGNQMGLPVSGVGPLLPSLYWSRPNSVIHDVQMRQPKNQGNYSDDQILQWLGKKPRKSVIYVAFGSEVSPSKEEILQLASVLEGIAYPFIWVVQNDLDDLSFNFDDFDKKIGDRGLIVRGWAPQLMILSHPSTGGFMSHCGWNSTLEAIGCGVPVLAWPIRGDQIYNAKLVVNHLKIGYMALPSGSFEVVKDDLTSVMEKLMMDDGVHKRADVLGAKFRSGFPSSSVSAIDAIKEVFQQNQT